MELVTDAESFGVVVRKCDAIFVDDKCMAVTRSNSDCEIRLINGGGCKNDVDEGILYSSCFKISSVCEGRVGSGRFVLNIMRCEGRSGNGGGIESSRVFGINVGDDATIILGISDHVS